MKIKLKFFGFPEVEKKIGGKKIDLDLDGRTYGDHTENAKCFFCVERF